MAPLARVALWAASAAAAAGASAAASTAADPQPTQCAYETTAGCSAPHWAPRYAMRASLYTYCFGNCPLYWLGNNTNLGVFAGLVGVDHYWTKQGTQNCSNGVGWPVEWLAQDEFAIATKAVFPDVRILLYRITGAVPYAMPVHNLFAEHPEYLVRFPNGSICTMWYQEGITYNSTTKQPLCDFEIRAAAFNYANVDAQTWWIENAIMPTLVHGDGAWIDGDGPDNGSYGCSGNYDYGKLPAGYPALNVSEIDAFCVGEQNATANAQRWLIANNGFDYNCIDFITSGLPAATDNATVCSSKLRSLDHRPSSVGGGVVLYGSRTDSAGYDDDTVTQAVATFLLTRGDHWWMGLKSGSDSLNVTTASWSLTDWGNPTTNMTETSPNVFQRTFEGATVQLDCNTFHATFTTTEGWVAPPEGSWNRRQLA